MRWGNGLTSNKLTFKDSGTQAMRVADDQTTTWIWRKAMYVSQDGIGYKHIENLDELVSEYIIRITA
jgi:hypothetical protein